MAQDGDQQPVGQRQGTAPQDGVPGAFVVQADRRVVEEILLDCGQQVGEGAGVHAGEGGVVQPVRGPVRGLGAVLVARHRQRCRRLGRRVEFHVPCQWWAVSGRATMTSSGMVTPVG